MYQKFFSALCTAVFKYRLLVILFAILLFAGSVFYTIKNLTFNPNRDDLIGEGEEFKRLSAILSQEFDDPGDMVVVIEGGNEEKRRNFTDILARELKSNPQTFTDIFHKLDLRFLKKKGFLFLPKPTIEKIAEQVYAAQPLYKTISDSRGLSGLLLAIYQEIQETVKSGNAEEGFEEFIPALERIFRQMTRTIHGHISYTPLWESPVSEKEQKKADEIPDTVYTTLKDGEIYILTVKPKLVSNEFSPIHNSIVSLRTIINKLSQQFPELKIGLTGEPILEDDEMIASERDSTRASILALISIAFIFVIGFKAIGKPFMAIAALVIAIGWTLGFATLTVMHLNLLTVTFLPMVMGIGIDFGIQLIGRYEEELRNKEDIFKAMEAALSGTGKSLFTAGSTNSIGFFAAMLTPFNGVRELGIIAGAGILLCLIAMLTVLPALLFTFERYKGVTTNQLLFLPKRFTLLNLGNKISQYPRQIALTGAVLTLVFIIAIFFVKFDYNLLNMQSYGLESVSTELRLIAETDRSVLYASMITASLEKASRLKKILEKLPSIASVESPSLLLPEEYNEKLTMARMMHKHLAPVDFHKPLPEKVDWLKILETTKKLRDEFELIHDKIVKIEEFQIADSVLRLINSIDALLVAADKIDSQTASTRLAIFQRIFFSDLQAKFARLKKEVGHPITPEDLPMPLRKRFLSKSGKLYMLQIFPKENIWERAAQEKFINDLRKVDIDVTGTPITMYEYINLLMKSYKLAGVYALLAIIVVFFFHFRRIKSVCIVLIPLVIGFLWLIGIMGIFGIKFNPANFVTLPLLIGIGVANGVYVVERFQEEGSINIFSKSTGRTILLSALTTMAGFLSLITASHQGIASLGLIMTIGVLTTLIATLILLPAIISIFYLRRIQL